MKPAGVSTPGPWKWTGMREILAPGGGCICSLNGAMDAELSANARLIASAPALAALVEEAVERKKLMTIPEYDAGTQRSPFIPSPALAPGAGEQSAEEKAMRQIAWVENLFQGCEALKADLAALRAVNDELSAQIASSADLLNIWCRDENIQECKHPYLEMALREGIDRVWIKVSLGVSTLRAENEVLRAALTKTLDQGQHADGCKWWQVPARELLREDRRAEAEQLCNCYRRDAGEALAAARGEPEARAAPATQEALIEDAIHVFKRMRHEIPEYCMKHIEEPLHVVGSGCVYCAIDEWLARAGQGGGA